MFNKFAQKKDDVLFERATDLRRLTNDQLYAVESGAVFSPNAYSSAVVAGDLAYPKETQYGSDMLKRI